MPRRRSRVSVRPTHSSVSTLPPDSVRPVGGSTFQASDVAPELAAAVSAFRERCILAVGELPVDARVTPEEAARFGLADGDTVDGLRIIVRPLSPSDPRGF